MSKPNPFEEWNLGETCQKLRAWDSITECRLGPDCDLTEDEGRELLLAHKAWLNRVWEHAEEGDYHSMMNYHPIHEIGLEEVK